jgi:hypothetical protein
LKLSFSRPRRGGRAKPAKQARESGVPPLSKWERFGAGLTALGGVAVGALGFYASFDAVSAKAATWNFAEPWVLPAAIDSAIPVFTCAYLFLIRMDMPLWWARLVPWSLSLITCALNVASGSSLWSKVAHGAMSLLWVGVSEIAAHIYAVRIGAATGRRRQMDGVRWARWFLAPLPTFLLWRRMKLWEVTSYDDVLELEQDRQIYRSLLRSEFGRAWRRKAPVRAALPLRLARTGVPLKETAAAGLIAAGIDPMEMPGLPPSAAKKTPGLPPAPVPPAPAQENSSPWFQTPAAAATARPQVKAALPKQTAAPKAEEAPLTVAYQGGWNPEPADEAVTPSADDETPKGEADTHDALPDTENALYEVVVYALQNNQISRFNKGGDLTGAAMGIALGQTAQNGRKVRGRILTRYAAWLSEQGVRVPENFTVEDLAVPVHDATTAATAAAA